MTSVLFFSSSFEIVTLAGVAHELDREPAGRVEEHPPPPRLVRDQRRPDLAVHHELLDVPHPIERRPGPLVDLGLADLVRLIQRRAGRVEDEHGHESLRGAGEPFPPEERTDLFGLGRAVEHQHVGETLQVVSGEEDRHEQQVHRGELDRHVVAEVEHDHIAHDADADQRAEQGGPAGGEEQPADQLTQAAEDVVGHGRAHERPQEPHGRGVAEGLHQAVHRRRRELRRDDLVGPVRDHVRGEHEADIDPQPHIEPRVVAPFPVQEGPDQRGRHGDRQEAEDLDIVVGHVSAAGGLIADGDVEDVLPDPGHERAPHPEIPHRGHTDVGDAVQREREAVEDQVREGEAEQQLLHGSPGRTRPQVHGRLDLGIGIVDYAEGRGGLHSTSPSRQQWDSTWILPDEI